MVPATMSARRRADRLRGDTKRMAAGSMKEACFALMLAASLGACGSKTIAEAPDALPQAEEATPQRNAQAPTDVWTTPRTVAEPAAPRRATTFSGPKRIAETPYSNDQLVRNFIRIALRAEASDVGRFGGKGVVKWTTPLRYSVIGARPSDLKRIAALVSRLRLLTGIDMAEARGEPSNFRISFVPFNLRTRTVGEMSREVAFGPSVGRMVGDWVYGENAKCLGLIDFHPGTSMIAKADILIKDELPDQIRNDCIVEEIVQSLGLMNDDPRVNPSIFNDDGRYRELTSHDEYLLRILYDPQIRPGMRPGQAMMLANRIVYRLRPPPRPGFGGA